MTEPSQFERVVEIVERSDAGSAPTLDEVDFLVEALRQAAHGLEYESRQKLAALVDRDEVIGRLAEKAMVGGDAAGPLLRGGVPRHPGALRARTRGTRC